ncbi:MAG: acetate uptake transporter [Candidatus Hodarchaeales archaeon]|jgi:succinate-acetate transporter protein
MTETPTPAKPAANPAPLGLMGFGMTTVLLNLHNADIIGTDALGMIFAMGIFYGGLAQIIAGIMEYKQGNTFGTTAFTSYGLFWLTLVALKIFPELEGGAGWAEAVKDEALAYYLAMWGLFTLWMFFSTLNKNGALMFVFATLTILFFMLAIGHWVSIDDPSLGSDILQLAGLEGIVCGLSAIYLAMAQVTNETYGRTVLPIFSVQK